MENLEHILIFKTNVQSVTDKEALHALFDNNTDVQCWSVDTEDEDCVLRIVTSTLGHYQIIDMLNSKGYLCCELL